MVNVGFLKMCFCSLFGLFPRVFNYLSVCLLCLLSLEERQRAEKKTREAKGQKFTPRWFDSSEEVTTTPWGDLEIYQYNGKYSEHRAAADSSASIDDVKSTEFNPWQYGDLATE